MKKSIWPQRTSFRSRPTALQRRAATKAKGFGECDHCGGCGLEDRSLELQCGKCFGVGAIREEDRDPLCKHKEAPRLCEACDPNYIDRLLHRPPKPE